MGGAARDVVEDLAKPIVRDVFGDETADDLEEFYNESVDPILDAFSFGGRGGVADVSNRAFGDPLEAVPDEEEELPTAADPRTKDVSLLGPGDVRLGKGGDEATARTKSGKRKLSRPGS